MHCQPVECLEIMELSPFIYLLSNKEKEAMIRNYLTMLGWKRPSWNDRPYR